MEATIIYWGYMGLRVVYFFGYPLNPTPNPRPPTQGLGVAWGAIKINSYGILGIR